MKILYCLFLDLLFIQTCIAALQPRIISDSILELTDPKARFGMRFYSLSFGSHAIRSDYCTASPFHKNWLITAAHCGGDISAPNSIGIVYKSDLPLMNNYFGGSTLENGDPVWFVYRSIPHPYYLPNESLNRTFDLRLLYIREEILPNGKVEYVTLPPVRSMRTELNHIYKKMFDCYLAGWGGQVVPLTIYDPILDKLQPQKSRRNFSKGERYYMKFAYQRILSDNICRNRRVASWYQSWVIIKGAMICSNYYGGYYSGCWGDSGGGLMCGNVIEGVVSRGVAGCGTARIGRTYYVRVDQYIDWIRNVSGVN